MSRLRVWLVTPELHPRGGTERSLWEQVRRWGDRFDLSVYSMNTEETPTDLRVRRVPGPLRPHLLGFLGWFGLNTVMRWFDPRGRPDVVVSPGVNCLDADAIGVHIVFAKYRERTRASLPAGRGSRARRFHRRAYVDLVCGLERRVYRGHATLWAMSREDAGELEERYGRPSGTVEVVPYGVDTEAFHPDATAALRDHARKRLGVMDSRVVLMVGNDPVKKGLDLACAALTRLPSDVVLAFAGSAPPEEVRRVADASGVGRRVVSWPHVANVREYYAAADALLAPSREDSFHMPTLEAMAAGVPVVVSRRAGAAEILEDGTDAVIVADPADADSLAEHVRQVLDDDVLRSTLVVGGRETALRSGWDRNAERVADLIEREAATPRVLVLAPEARGVGGIQRVTRSLTQALSDAFGEDRVGILSLRAGENAIRGRVLREGAHERHGRVPLVEKAVFAIGSVLTSRRWRRRLGVVAAHPHLAPVAQACRVASGAPYAVWCHGIEAWTHPSPLVGRALRGADAVFAPSAFTARRVEEVAHLRSGSVRVIPHALPPVSIGSISVATRRPRVLTVARLTRENRYKGVDMLLYAWPRVRAEIDAELAVVGAGPDLGRLQAIVRLLDLEDSVTFAGRLSDEDLASAYASADVFAMPARHRLEPTPEGEGFGLVYAEAGARGVPVVASSGGGVDDVVRDGVNGLLVDPEDAADVARAIVRLLTDPDLAARLGDEGRRLATVELAPERFRERIEGLIRDDLRPRGLVT